MLDDGAVAVWLIFLSSWGCDTCAYCVGMLLGKHKMAPKLSPKKSVEGGIGGIVGAALLGAIQMCIRDRGAEQCGFCNPGMIMNAIAMFRENPEPTREEIKAYLAGNLCRCSGYEGQLRAMEAFIEYRKKGERS